MNSRLPDRVIFFDGYCVACNKMVAFLLDKDSVWSFRFATLQSEIAEITIPAFGYPLQSVQNLDSVVYVRLGKARTKSDAILSIAVDIGGVYKVASLFYLIPKWIRDMVYDAFARHRYGWFGKNELCRVPTANEITRFLD
jgi:predicted DCC family thiol-disulfide oxidoreductase YuxK